MDAAAARRLTERLRVLVSIETPAGDIPALRAGIATLAAMVRDSLGREPRILEPEGGPPALLSEAPADPSVLLLCHLDTVWPRGTIADFPFVVTGERASGPGVFDMKAGLLIGLDAAERSRARDHITLLVTCDEEVGSGASRELVERTAAGAAAVLVLEGSGPDGALKDARKGVAIYDLVIQGLEAHAGVEPEAGINATVELAHLVLDLGNLADPSLGTTVTPSVAASGTTTNTVPAAARLAVDVRAWTAAELERVDAAIRARVPVVPRATVTVLGGVNRLPLESVHSAGLLAAAREIAAEHGLGAVPSCAVGGGSDGNFTAALGIPTLDGLGGVGGGGHTRTEWVDLASMAIRAELIARLVERIVRMAGPAHAVG
jgi:glutamate carboxypeptidase